VRHGLAFRDSVTGETEQYLTVELDTASPNGTFERPRLDLVAVLDVSDSMSGPVDGYYYDRPRDESGGAAATKLSAAARSLCALVGQLCENDRLGVVLCDDDTHVAKPLRKIASTDTTATRRQMRVLLDRLCRRQESGSK
jgi:Ca-activated chloride channel family protein